MQENVLVKNRLLYMYELLTEGRTINKKELAAKFAVSERSVQRDLDDLRTYFAEKATEDGFTREVVYDRRSNGYRLVPPLHSLLSSEESFAVLKILLESRAFTKAELNPILDKIIDCCVPLENKQHVTELISNERFHYIEPQHRTKFLQSMWNFSLAIAEKRQLKIVYRRMNGSIVNRTVQPVGIMFSEFYFYLTAFIPQEERAGLQYDADNAPFPTIYRIDRITWYEFTDVHFKVPYANRFEEGEFRKRVQFMYGGKLRRIKFYFRGPSLEAVLDRLPTAEVLGESEKGYLIGAEVYGDGVQMWLRSQGENVELV